MPIQWDGRDIVALRAQMKLTQSELAKRLGVDQATVSRWERSVQAPDPTARLQLREFLFRTGLAIGMAPEIALVKFSPFLMSIIAEDWSILALSLPLSAMTDPFMASAAAPKERPRKRPCADLEYAVARLKEEGFFVGKVHAAKVVARGFLHGSDHWPFESLCTPVLIEGEVCRLSQYQFLSEADFARRREQMGAVTILSRRDGVAVPAPDTRPAEMLR